MVYKVSYHKLPRRRVRSLLVLYPIFLFIILSVSSEFKFLSRIIVVSVYMLTATLNVMNLSFLIRKTRIIKRLLIDLGTDFKKRMIFLIGGLLILFGIDTAINFLYQIMYIALFISTDSYISHVGRVHILSNRKEG